MTAPPSVARKAEQVPSVMHEVVHRMAGDQGGGALLGADDVDQQRRQDRAEDCPGRQRAQRDRCRNAICVRDDACGLWTIPAGMARPGDGVMAWMTAWLPQVSLAVTVARPCRACTGFLVHEGLEA